MTETGIVNVQISSDLKQDAEKALAKLSLTPEEAIEDFYQQIAAAYRAGGDAWLDLPRVTCCLCWGRISNSLKPTSDEHENCGDLRFASFEDWMAFHLAEDTMEREDNGKGCS